MSPPLQQSPQWERTRKATYSDNDPASRASISLSEQVEECAFRNRQGMWGQVERCAREDSKETGGSLPAQQLEFNLYLRSSSSQVSVHISSNLSMLVVTHEYALCSIKADPPLFIGKRVTEKWRYCELNSGLCNLCCFPAKIAIDSSYPRLIRLLIFNRTLVAHLSLY